MAKNFTWTDKAILSWIDIWARIWGIKTLFDFNNVETNLCSWVWQVGDVYIEPGMKELCAEVLTRESDFITFHTIGAIPLPGLNGVLDIRRECEEVAETRFTDLVSHHLLDELDAVIEDIDVWGDMFGQEC